MALFHEKKSTSLAALRNARRLVKAESNDAPLGVTPFQNWSKKWTNRPFQQQLNGQFFLPWPGFLSLYKAKHFFLRTLTLPLDPVGSPSLKGCHAPNLQVTLLAAQMPQKEVFQRTPTDCRGYLSESPLTGGVSSCLKRIKSDSQIENVVYFTKVKSTVGSQREQRFHLHVWPQ